MMKNYKYLNDRIENKLMSQLVFHQQEIRKYFKQRHDGVGGIDKEMARDLVISTIRDYKVWKEMWVRNEFYKLVSKV